jgi:methyltransferase (TIGR00027 family)
MFSSTIRSVSLSLLFVSLAATVEPNKPSKTSVWVTTARAIGAKNPDPELRNPDYLAIKFLGPSERAILADEYPMDALDLDYAEAIKRIPVPVAAHVSRTKYIDAALVEALGAGAKQVVVLGAGFDTRGLRFESLLKGVRFLEVDYGPTQEYKKRRTIDIFGSLPRHIGYVPMDFTKDDLLTQLRRAGYADKDKTFFIWEGVVMYIPESAVKDTLHFVRAHSAAGSRIIFNYPLAGNPDITDPNSRYVRWGEPWVFGFPGESAVAFVRKEGLEVVSDVSGLDLIRQSSARSDGTSNLPVKSPPAVRDLRFCVARVPVNGRQQ